MTVKKKIAGAFLTEVSYIPSNMEDRVKKLREERVAREQARIQKLRELNIKKYSKGEVTSSSSSQLVGEKKIASTSQIKVGAVTKNIQTDGQRNVKTDRQRNVKSNVNISTTKRPVTVPVGKKTDYANIKPKVITKFPTKSNTKIDSNPSNSCIPNKLDAFRVVQNGTKDNKNVTNKVSTSNFGVNSKPDITITGNSESKAEVIASNIQISDSKSDTNNIDNIITSNIPSKPDIVITTQNDHADRLKGKKVLTEITKKVTVNAKLFQKNDVKSRKSYAPTSNSNGLEKPKINVRKSMLPKLMEGSKSESVFDRLYKPKVTTKPTPVTEAEKLRTDPSYLKKAMKNADFILHLQGKPEIKQNQRRSISAVHFKHITKSELGNCIHKWGSIGDKLDKIDLQEPETKDEKVMSAVKSERKKVQFLTPSLTRFSTPGPDELQARLKSWLQKRGKSLNSYQHLQCFGLRHLTNDFQSPKSVSSVPFEDAEQSPRVDDENKENKPLDSDSDDGSFAEIMNEPKEILGSGDKIDTKNWRSNVSMASESVYNESNASRRFDDTLTPADSVELDDLLQDALKDLYSLLEEGYDWQQAARWLRSIRARYPHAPRTAIYWECRAILEDARGNLNASINCWEEAIAKGTEKSVVESNVDQLLTKFMQLKISPQGGGARAPDSKLLDVKNVFKSTIIKFAVQQAKLREQGGSPAPCTVTPVRRSARLSQCAGRTPLRLCDSVRHAAALAPQHVFTPNRNLELP